MIIKILHSGNTTINIHNDYIPESKEENSKNKAVLDSLVLKIVEKQYQKRTCP